jgi:hypothetical protein
MFTVVETSLFQKQWPLYWSEEERGEFAAYIAEFPNAGNVVPLWRYSKGPLAAGWYW